MFIETLFPEQRKKRQSFQTMVGEKGIKKF